MATVAQINQWITDKKAEFTVEFNKLATCVAEACTTKTSLADLFTAETARFNTLYNDSVIRKAILAKFGEITGGKPSFDGEELLIKDVSFVAPNTRLEWDDGTKKVKALPPHDHRRLANDRYENGVRFIDNPLNNITRFDLGTKQFIIIKLPVESKDFYMDCRLNFTLGKWAGLSEIELDMAFNTSATTTTPFGNANVRVTKDYAKFGEVNAIYGFNHRRVRFARELATDRPCIILGESDGIDPNLPADKLYWNVARLFGFQGRYTGADHDAWYTGWAIKAEADLSLYAVQQEPTPSKVVHESDLPTPFTYPTVPNSEVKTGEKIGNKDIWCKNLTFTPPLNTYYVIATAIGAVNRLEQTLNIDNLKLNPSHYDETRSVSWHLDSTGKIHLKTVGATSTGASTLYLFYTK